ncbi:hypothetical protein HZA97_06960 [Candidatus Woesearchaeota archaeon]|nr:hypothetical protein [Candidatus Woesearchaeota archaeon]
MAAKKSKFKNSSKLQQIILGIGILVLLVAFILYGLEVFYKEPTYDQFCNYYSTTAPKPYYEEPTEVMCNTAKGKWFPREGPCPAAISKESVNCPAGYCDFDFYCRPVYEKAQEKHSMYVLFVLSTLGVAIIIGGLFVSVQVISNSIMAGGVIIILRGVIGAWNFLSKYLQWALLGVLLALLLWVAYKKFGPK